MHDLTSENERFSRASRVLPGGVTGVGRLNTALGRSIEFSRGDGAVLYDSSGRPYIDLNTGFGALLLGHSHPGIRSAVGAALERGMLTGYETDLGLAAAERLCEVIPSLEMVRFALSGTEAGIYAIRTARAFTGRRLVVKFEGHFHGYSDSLGISCWPPFEGMGPDDAPEPYAQTAGAAPGAETGTLVAPWNNEAALTRLMERYGRQVAAVICEPVNYNQGCILPQPGFLQFLSRIADTYGALLIFDEVLSGFRTAPGGMQEDYGVTPDMTMLSKSMAGGMPLSAFGGRRDIMETVSPAGPAMNTSTFAAHPTAMAGCLAFLEAVTAPGFYEALRTLEERFYTGLRQVLARSELPITVQHRGPRFGLYFGLDREVWAYRDQAGQDTDLKLAFYRAILDEGVYMNCAPHNGFAAVISEAEIDQALDGIERACRTVRAS